MRVHNINELWVSSIFKKNALVTLVALFAAFFLTLVFPSADAYANDATWEGGSVVYNGDTYQGPRQAADGNPPGVPDGSTYYEYLNDGTARIVYFEGDPTDASSARTATYSVSNGDYTQTSRGTTISIDRQVDVEADSSDGDEHITSCVVNGIGYIVCPIIQFLAEATDTMYGYLENFLQVEPLVADQDSTLYRAWAIARNVANLAFIVVFLLVIYSHLTSAGLNNYDLKKTIPRMLVAAVAVNLSYYIAAFLVDLSNIVGSSLNQLFISIVNEVGQGAERNVLASASFSEIATYVLSGGTLVAAGLFQGAAMLSGMGTGVLFLFIVILLPIAIVVLVTVTVLAARLAIITVLIVLAPLAFVAYVLPGTKQLFDKWQDLFTTMLLMYPLFAVLFGGSHLASYLIAQNADRWETVLIALFVQAVPLVITPFLVRFSGRLLGNFAGMVNNPAKGAVDRSKNWARDKASEAQERRLAQGAMGTGLATWNDNRKRNREGRRKRYEDRNALRFSRSRAGRGLIFDEWVDRDDKTIHDNQMSAEYERRKVDYRDGLPISPKMHDRALELKESEMGLSLSKARTEGYMENIQSEAGRRAVFGEGGHDAPNKIYRDRANEIGRLSLEAMAENASREQAMSSRRAEFSEQIIDDTSSLRHEAAGIAGDRGASLALANAVRDVRADFGKGSSAYAEMFDHYNLSGDSVKKLALGREVEPVVVDGKEVFNFSPEDAHVRDAAIGETVGKLGNYPMQLEIVSRSGTDEYAEYRGTISNNLGKFIERAGLSGSFIEKVRTGKIASEQDYINEIQSAIRADKFKASTLTRVDAAALEHWLKAAQGMNLKRGSDDRKSVEGLVKAANEALTNDQINVDLQPNARETLSQIGSMIIPRDESS